MINMRKIGIGKKMMAVILAVAIMVSPMATPKAYAKKRDTTPPTISNVKVTQVTSDGYKVSCTVTDSSGVDAVYLPTWTNKNGQDDLKWHKMNLKNNTASVYVKVGEHNGETGNYTSHIYAYDTYGNCAGYGELKTIKVPKAKGVNFLKLQAKYPDYSKWNSSYKGKAWQCHGFALTLGEAISGVDPSTKWAKKYNLNGLKAGDIIRFSRPHTIMITSVSGNKVTYVDCNWVGKNKVKWNQTVSINKLTSKFGKLSYVLVRP